MWKMQVEGWILHNSLRCSVGGEMGNDRKEGWQPPPPTRGRDLVGEKGGNWDWGEKSFNILILRGLWNI